MLQKIKLFEILEFQKKIYGDLHATAAIANNKRGEHPLPEKETGLGLKKRRFYPRFFIVIDIHKP
jgi:hypothetical protein